ncbi:MAG: PAS domain-containing methyl-accepting chemotaxis protein [Planctomycetota bacterium]
MAGPSDIKPINEPRAFELSELFFSTTDRKGVIRYGNETFTRIAGYTLSEMVGRPHNLVRHPDMPRAAFRLVWDDLSQGKTVAAYVKNLARDGRYYWVLALIMPTDAGYLSIRLKPSSKVFAHVKDVYARALDAEKAAAGSGANSRAVMDAGAASITDSLGSLGFTTYDGFMSSALTAELTSRAEQLGPTGNAGAQLKADGEADPQRRRLLALFEGAHRLDRELGGVIADPSTFAHLRDRVIPKSDYFLKMGRLIRLQSVNAEVQAARLGEAGRALAMVSERLSSNAGDGAQAVGQLNGKLRQLTDPIARLVFDAMVCKVQVEMAATFVRDIIEGRHDASEDGRLAENLQLLFGQFLGRVRGIPQALDDLQTELATIDREVRELGQFTRTMHFIYLTGKIETARHDQAQSFAAIFEEIRRMIEQADKVLAELLDSVGTNQKQIKRLGRIDASAFEQLDQLLAA